MRFVNSADALAAAAAALGAADAIGLDADWRAEMGRATDVEGGDSGVGAEAGEEAAAAAAPGAAGGKSRVAVLQLATRSEARVLAFCASGGRAISDRDSPPRCSLRSAPFLGGFKKKAVETPRNSVL